MAKPRGFSVIELLVVVAIILVLSAIAIVHYRRARIAANQASAMASIHAINVAESTYALNYPQMGYSPNLIKLGSNGSDCQNVTSSNACLLDPTLAVGIKSGYVFDLMGDGNVPDASYTVTATPEAPGLTGLCTYTSSQSAQVSRTNAQPDNGLYQTGATAATGCGGN
jgi:type IV pilus assembly protein PilA